MAYMGHPIKEPFRSRLWNAIRPPPKVPGQRKPLNRGQRRLIWGSLSVLVPVAAGLGIYQYVSSAEERAGKAFEQGMALMGPGHYQDAIPLFTRAVEIWPQHAQAYFERGNAHQILNQPDAALADFELALKIDPNLAPAYTARGIIYVERGDFPKALLEFDQSIRVHPTVDGYYQRGQIHYRLKQFPKAIDDYDQAIALGRDTPFIYLSRASAKTDLGDAAGAAQDRETAMSLQKGR
jgi:tetratricopeptide (TPR) repeat protein